MTRLRRAHRHVLLTLADGQPRAAADPKAWRPATTASARSAIRALTLRGLVEVAGRNAHHQRTYQLTTSGAELARCIADEREAA